jgi:hypothetical protein
MEIGCNQILFNPKYRTDSIVIYAISTNDLVFDKSGIINPKEIKSNGQRFLINDSAKLKTLDTLLFSNSEFVAYSRKSFSLETEYDEIGESIGFFRVYEVYFKEDSCSFITQIATNYSNYLYIGYNRYGTCKSFLKKLRTNEKYIRYKTP